MTVKEEAHRLIDQASEQTVAKMLVVLRQLHVSDRGTVSEQVEVWIDDQDTSALVALSSSALLRDWNSAADAVYDDERA